MVCGRAVSGTGLRVLDAGAGPAVQLSARERLTFPKGAREGSAKGHRVVLSTATFGGALRVTDPEHARRTLLQGIGPGKAYGCGPLTLAPLSGPGAVTAGGG